MLEFKKLIIVLGLCTSLASAGIIPVGRPDTDYGYKYLRELYLRCYQAAASSLYTPFDHRDIQGLPDNKGSGSTDGLITYLKRTADYFTTESEHLNFQITVIPSGTSGSRPGNSNLVLIPGLGYRASNSWSIQAAYRIDGNLADDSEYTGKVWGDFAGFAELALLSYRGKRLSLDLGRSRNFWGVAKNGYALMHSSAAMPLDGLFLQYDFGQRLSLYSTIAYLSPVGSPIPFSDQASTENRYYSAHALRFSPWSWWDIVLKESVIYGGIGR